MYMRRQRRCDKADRLIGFIWTMHLRKGGKEMNWKTATTKELCAVILDPGANHEDRMQAYDELRRRSRHGCR